jgi:transcriptional regulator with XRE-family HTH domain
LSSPAIRIALRSPLGALRNPGQPRSWEARSDETQGLLGAFCCEIIINMVIGERVHSLRVAKKMTQQDIEDRTGLKRCYLSRVENGNTVPSIHTVEKLAAALEVPMYRLFYEGEGAPPGAPLFSRHGKSAAAEAKDIADRDQMMGHLRRIWAKLDSSSRNRLFTMANLMAERSRPKPLFRKRSGAPKKKPLGQSSLSKK